jgi:hypothetical protein
MSEEKVSLEFVSHASALAGQEGKERQPWFAAGFF